jgi:membrane protease YdiL (CAAX protease family)
VSLLPRLDARGGAREALIAGAALLLLLEVGKHVVAAFGPAGPYFFTFVAGFQIYVPLWLIQRRGEAPEAYAIHAHGALLGPVAALRRRVVLARKKKPRAARGPKRSKARELLATYGRGAHFRGKDFAFDVGRALLLAAVTFPPFALGHDWWQHHFGAPGYRFTVPSDIVETLLKNTFLIALPEEMFYRGFLEHRLDRLWPTKTVLVWLVPLSRTVFLASAMFALGHFLGEYNPARLGPFFPAFVFSGLTRKSGSISGGILYHGMSNAFSALLFAGYVR